MSWMDREVLEGSLNSVKASHLAREWLCGMSCAMRAFLGLTMLCDWNRPCESLLSGRIFSR